jgi:hypothetical protein
MIIPKIVKVIFYIVNNLNSKVIKDINRYKNIGEILVIRNIISVKRSRDIY